MNYPKYKCHKEVSAVKITGVEHGADGSMTLHLADGFDNVLFSHEEMKRTRRPEAGWYLIIYSDGFKSFSPAKAFEDGYAPITGGDGAGGQTATGNNVIAFESAIRWREYAAALELKLNLDTGAIAGDESRTKPPSAGEIEALSGLPASTTAPGGGSSVTLEGVDDDGDDDDEDGEHDEETDLAASATG